MTSSTCRSSKPPCSLTVSRHTSYPCWAALPGCENSPVSGSEIPILIGSPLSLPDSSSPPHPTPKAAIPATANSANHLRARFGFRSDPLITYLPARHGRLRSGCWARGIAIVCCNRVQPTSSPVLLSTAALVPIENARQAATLAQGADDSPGEEEQGTHEQDPRDRQVELTRPELRDGPLVERDDQDGADHRSCDSPAPPDDRHQHHVGRNRDREEDLGTEIKERVAPKGAPDTDEDAAQGEGGNLVGVRVNPGDLRLDLVLGDRTQAETEARVPDAIREVDGAGGHREHRVVERHLHQRRLRHVERWKRDAARAAEPRPVVEA